MGCFQVLGYTLKRALGICSLVTGTHCPNILSRKCSTYSISRVIVQMNALPLVVFLRAEKRMQVVQIVGLMIGSGI